MSFEEKLDYELQQIRCMLLHKNKAYGNSALDPIRVFSKADSADGLRLRIDDKLSRISRGESAGEDTIKDLIGYLILLRIADADSINELLDGLNKRTDAINNGTYWWRKR